MHVPDGFLSPTITLPAWGAAARSVAEFRSRKGIAAWVESRLAA